LKDEINDYILKQIYLLMCCCHSSVTFSSVLWCTLRCPHEKTMFRSSLLPFCRGSCFICHLYLFTCICVQRDFHIRLCPFLTDHASSPPVISGILVAQSLVFWLLFCISLIVLLSFYLWTSYCLSFNDLRILIFGIFKLILLYFMAIMLVVVFQL